MSDRAPQHKYRVLNTMQDVIARYKIKGTKMESIKRFLRNAWDMIVIIQTARAAEHLARCGRYRAVRELMLGDACYK